MSSAQVLAKRGAVRPAKINFNRRVCRKCEKGRWLAWRNRPLCASILPLACASVSVQRTKPGDGWCYSPCNLILMRSAARPCISGERPRTVYGERASAIHLKLKWVLNPVQTMALWCANSVLLNGAKLKGTRHEISAPHVCTRALHGKQFSYPTGQVQISAALTPMLSEYAHGLAYMPVMTSYPWNALTFA